MKHSSTPDVPGELREPEVLSAPMEMLEETERAKIYAERTKRVREYCKYMPNDTMIDEWKTGSDVSNADFPMVVDPIHKILYCELPKVGSSNWKRVLIKLTDPRYEDVKNVLAIRKPRKYEHYNLKKIGEYPLEERLDMLKNFYKFTVVRDPIERILSAYKDKAYEEFRGKAGSKVEKYLEERNMTEEFAEYDIESFHTFVQYLIARGPEAAAGGHFGVRVRHWTRFYDICHFCAIDWDFIGKVESIYEDATWLLKEAGVGNLVSYPYFKKATATDLIKKYYSGLSRETLMKLYDTYRLDFELFGYGIPDYLMTFSDETSKL